METRLILCTNTNCNYWEELPSDEQRHHSQSFKWLENLDDGEAMYRCPNCKRITFSKTVENDDDD